MTAYNDELYLHAVSEIGRLAGVIADMDGSTVETVREVFDQVLENLDEDDDG